MTPRPNHLGQARRAIGGLVAGLLLGAGAVLGSGAVAGAAITGPCDITVDGASIKDLSSSDPGDAIVVGPDDRFSVTFTADGDLQSHAIDLDYAGITWSVVDNNDTKAVNTVTRYVSVADYRRYGVGLYKVSGNAVLSDGRTCEGAVLVKVTGSPFATAAGIGSGLLTLAGVAGIGAATVATTRGVRRGLVKGARP